MKSLTILTTGRKTMNMAKLGTVLGARNLFQTPRKPLFYKANCLIPYTLCAQMAW